MVVVVFALGLTALVFLSPLFMRLFGNEHDQPVPPKTVPIVPAPALAPPDDAPPPAGKPIEASAAPLTEPAPTVDRQMPTLLPLVSITNLPGLGDFNGGPIRVSLPEPASELPKVYDLGEVDRKAKVTFVSPVTYPAHLRRERVIGRARLTLVINPDGTVREIENIEEVSHPDFIPVLRDWVKQWKYEPAMKDGRAVSQRVRQPVQLDPGR